MSGKELLLMAQKFVTVTHTHRQQQLRLRLLNRPITTLPHHMSTNESPAPTSRPVVIPSGSGAMLRACRA